MAIIRCTEAEDGSLTPLTVKFEQGDVIEVDSSDSATLMEVLGSFTLADMSQNLERLTVPLDASGIVGDPVRNKRPKPKVPAPPPEDGAFSFKPTTGTCKAIRVVIDKAF
jgi:hypothetical protein